MSLTYDPSSVWADRSVWGARSVWVLKPCGVRLFSAAIRLFGEPRHLGDRRMILPIVPSGVPTPSPEYGASGAPAAFGAGSVWGAGGGIAAESIAANGDQ